LVSDRWGQKRERRTGKKSIVQGEKMKGGSVIDSVPGKKKSRQKISGEGGGEKGL